MAADRTRLVGSGLAAAYGQRPGSPPSAVTSIDHDRAAATPAQCGTTARSPGTTARRFTSRHSSKRARSSVLQGSGHAQPRVFRKCRVEAAEPLLRRRNRSVVGGRVRDISHHHTCAALIQPVHRVGGPVDGDHPPTDAREVLDSRSPDTRRSAPETRVTVSACMSSPHWSRTVWESPEKGLWHGQKRSTGCAHGRVW